MALISNIIPTGMCAAKLEQLRIHQMIVWDYTVEGGSCKETFGIKSALLS